MAAPTNWKLILSYNGTRFHGWQIQPGLPTVQGILSDSLHRLTGERVLPQGSGRTDAGVHALAQVCSFQLQAPIPPANLQSALNRMLPPDIRILSAEPMPPTFHARHSVRGKTYEYRLFERILPATPTPSTQLPEDRICSPFLAPFVWDCRWPLSLIPMQQAAALLLGTHDFTSMAAVDPERALRDPDPDRSLRDPKEDSNDPHPASTQPNPLKTLTHSAWRRTNDLLLYRVTGSGFLHHMVRNLVGTLVEIGRGSLTVADLPRILAARNRSAAGPTAPAHGLYLIEVHYDSDEAKP